ncbi:hypothetical protein [Flavobacterium sp. F52]|uniref:hypothetical protein n=1 Tax=Flavobacterium sp. F52 TaxID=1202532 RepID=UPI0002730CCB|nr:hypothetical protein [Flavobacterium sp. F52]EJG01667.1 hypothetical protein FF52_11423 [Flavobacterium sp. F52]
MIKKYLSVTGTVFLLFTIISCKDSKTAVKESNTEVTELKEIPEVEESAIEIKKDISDFIPKNYVPFDTIKGDFNKDGLEDCILIIKGTYKSKIVIDEYRGELDRNRRGIIALLNKNSGYELAVKNYDCFSSENEDGGVYYAPELYIEVKNDKLYVDYAHGRYGYWKYTFRYQNSDFELIGYDASSNHGPVILTETSINFLTRKKIVNQNVNENTYDGDEIFEKTETKIARTKLLKLSEIKDFDELDISEEK